MDPLDKSMARLLDLEYRIENDEPIDWEKEAQLQAIHIVQAGVHYTQQAIERVNNADKNSQDLQETADGKQLNGN